MGERERAIKIADQEKETARAAKEAAANKAKRAGKRANAYRERLKQAREKEAAEKARFAAASAIKCHKEFGKEFPNGCVIDKKFPRGKGSDRRMPTVERGEITRRSLHPNKKYS